jgi:hypothetical protein
MEADISGNYVNAMIRNIRFVSNAVAMHRLHQYDRNTAFGTIGFGKRRIVTAVKLAFPGSLDLVVFRWTDCYAAF